MTISELSPNASGIHIPSFKAPWQRHAAAALQLIEKFVGIAVGAVLALMARSNSPTRGHPKFPQAGRPDYDDSGLTAMRAAASFRR